MSALGSALDSIHQASALLDRTASRLAKPISVTGDSGGDTVDFSAEILALLEARSTAAIGVKLAQSADELQKTSLDVLA